MFELTSPELVTLGIGGAALAGLCVIKLPVVIDVRFLCFVLGCVMLAIALISMVTD